MESSNNSSALLSIGGTGYARPIGNEVLNLAKKAMSLDAQQSPKPLKDARIQTLKVLALAVLRQLDALDR